MSTPHVLSTPSRTTPRNAAIRDYRYFEYKTPPQQTSITKVNSDSQLKSLVISIKKKNVSSSSEQTWQGFLGSMTPWRKKPQTSTQRQSSVTRTNRNSNVASSNSMNGVKQVASTSSTRSGASSTTKAIPTRASSAREDEIIFLTAPNSWYGKFISWIFGNYKDIADELRIQLGEGIITQELHQQICKEGITVEKLKKLYTTKGSDDTATLSGEPDNNDDTASTTRSRSGSISSVTSTERLSSPGTSSASLSSDSSHVTPLATPSSIPSARPPSSSISLRSSSGANASDATGLSGASILPDHPQHNQTGAARIHVDTFPPVANNTNPVVNSPIAENKNNSKVPGQEALLSALSNVITTANPSDPVRFNSLKDLNTFYQERMQALKNRTNNQGNIADANHLYLSEDILNQITNIIAENGYQLVNTESGKFEFTPTG